MAGERFRERVEQTITALDESLATGNLTEGATAVVQSLEATLQALAESLGECRLDTPYSSMRPILDEQGNFQWCCNHETEHCAG